MAKNVPRKHHYLPQFYLAGFTPSGSKDDWLYVHDIQRKQTRPMKPVNVAFQTNYNSVEVEKGIADFFEDSAAKVIKKISDTQWLPQGEDFDVLMRFVLLMSARVPIVRDYDAAIAERNMRHHFKYLAEHNPTELASKIAELKDMGVEFPEDMSAETLKKLDVNHYPIKLPLIWHMLSLIDIINGLNKDIHLLLKRRWALYIAKDGVGNFICSDKPVIDFPIRQDPDTVHETRYILPDFRKDTTVIMPLTRQIALVGEFDDGINGRAFVDARIVANVNGFLLSPTEFTSYDGKHAMSYIYSAEKDFTWIRPDSNIGNVHDFFKSLPKSDNF